jgi:hypothetical protein
VVSLKVKLELRDTISVYGPPDTVERYRLYPTTPALVLGVHDKLTICWTAPAPLPVNTSVIEEVVALLRNDSDSVALPDACG